MKLEEVFGANMRRLRKAQGLSQEQLAHDVGLAPSYLGQLERGQRSATLGVVQRVCERLGAAPAEMLTTPMKW